MKLIPVALLLLCLHCASAQIPNQMTPDPNMPNLLPASQSLFIEELTWLEVRNAMKAGKTTIIVATGGIEQNGPYLALGKHNYVLRATTEAIAHKLGNALVAPIIAFVPEGDIDPPTGHMKYPGTISLTDKTFQLLLTDIAASMKTHGFKHIIFIGDSGGNQKGMKATADSLAQVWDPKIVTVNFIPEYYTQLAGAEWLATRGIVEKDEGIHHDFGITASIMTVDPKMVKMDERIKAGKFTVNGVNLAPAKKTIALGKEMVDYRAERTVEAIHKAIGN